MKDFDTLDFSRLLGFDAVSDKLADGVDFHDETVRAKIGAKVGPEPVNPLDHSKLLGFDSVADRLSGGVDFHDETVGAKLGAKVGGEIQTAE